VGVTILSHAGLSDLIADNRDGYREIAVALAADAARRESLRESLRQTLIDSPLCDGEDFAHGFQDALRDMWRRWCRERHPQSSS
jgi:protein O-GlcNAc transferase